MTLAQNRAGRERRPVDPRRAIQSADFGDGSDRLRIRTAQRPLPAPCAAASPSVETPVASTASPAASRPVVANAPDARAGDRLRCAPASASPATVLGARQSPASGRSRPGASGWSRWAIGTLRRCDLLLAGILLICLGLWFQFSAAVFQGRSGIQRVCRSTRPTLTRVESAERVEQLVAPGRLAGGPPQVSLQLARLRAGLAPRGHAVDAKRDLPLGTMHGPRRRPRTAASAGETFVAPEPYAAPASGSFGEGVGEPIVRRQTNLRRSEPSIAESPAAPRTEELDSAS